jgi:hypothetical protein
LASCDHLDETGLMGVRMTFPGVNRYLALKDIPKDGCLEAPVQGLGTNQGERRPTSAGHVQPAMRHYSRGKRERAKRFPIRTLLCYRRVGEEGWRHATMVNISESGVLFETDHAAWPKTAVEMKFSLGLGSPGASAAQVVCQGLIARAITEAGSAKVKALAARITKFHFLRSIETVEV